MTILYRNGRALKYAPPSIKANSEAVLVAMWQYPLAIEYAHRRVKADVSKTFCQRYEQVCYM